MPLGPSCARHAAPYGPLGRAALASARRTISALARGLSVGALAAHTLFPLVSALWITVCAVGPLSVVTRCEFVGGVLYQ